MNLAHLLFSFQGRIDRAQFRQGSTISGFVVGLIGFFLVTGILSFSSEMDRQAKLGALMTLGPALLVFLVWSNAALQVKRLHDRGRSGVWAVIPVFLFAGWAIFICKAFWASADPEGHFWTEGGGDFALALNAASFVVAAWTFVDLGMLPGTPGPNSFGDEPGAPPPLNRPDGSPPAHKSWFKPKPSPTHSWDVSTADAAIAKALADRIRKSDSQTNGAAQDYARTAPSNAGGRSSFGRRN